MPLEEKYLQLIGSTVSVADESVKKRLSRLFDCVVETNRQINITSLTSPIDATLKHLIDSLTLFSYPEFVRRVENGARVCDIGCGGGFPGLPLACVMPELDLTMIDSTEKKIRALEENAAKLALSGVTPVWGRGEELAGKGGAYRERYDVCVSRAVARLPVLLELCLPFVKVGGIFIALKGQKTEEELEDSRKAIPMLGGELKEVFEIPLSADPSLIAEFDEEEQEKIREFFSASRTLVVVEKKKPTNPIYPRKWAQMTKKPL
jgi:16S rRNA (guanine527-N7)-methyltransferase